MELQSTFKQVALSRRTFLFLGGTLGVGVVFTQVMSPSEEKIWLSLHKSWTKNWSPADLKPLKSIEGVLELVREDKRSELSLALKLLSIAPICFFLTGHFSPWSDPRKVGEILKRWQFSNREMEKKLYGAFSAIINSSFYGNPASWTDIHYPGPPGFTRHKGSL